MCQSFSLALRCRLIFRLDAVQRVPIRKVLFSLAKKAGLATIVGARNALNATIYNEQHGLVSIDVTFL